MYDRTHAAGTPRRYSHLLLARRRQLPGLAGCITLARFSNAPPPRSPLAAAADDHMHGAPARLAGGAITPTAVDGHKPMGDPLFRALALQLDGQSARSHTATPTATPRVAFVYWRDGYQKASTLHATCLKNLMVRNRAWHIEVCTSA